MISGGALLVALFSQSAIGAAPGAIPARARLEVRGAQECTSRSDLAARVAARSPRIQFVDDAAVSARITVTSARPGKVVAELVLGATGATPLPRRVVARSCAEAADGIALIIAVTLDPTLKQRSVVNVPQEKTTGPGEAGSRAGPDTTGGAGPTPEPAREPTQPPVAKPTAEAAPAKPPAPPATVESPAVSAQAAAGPAKRQLGVYLAGQTIFGPAPSALPGIAAYAMAALNREGAFSPALIVGATHLWRADLSEPDGAASFTLDAASLDACPVRLGGSRLAVRPCASALVGRLTASGSNTAVPASAARPFAALGAAVAAGLGIGARLELSVRLGVGATLIRDAYEFGTAPFHRAERVTTSASLGIGAHWP